MQLGVQCFIFRRGLRKPWRPDRSARSAYRPPASLRSNVRRAGRPGAGHPLPRRVSTDHDPLFRAHRWQASLRVLGAEEIKTAPYVPLSHPFVERAIGTVRREYLDHPFFWNSLDLQRKLEEFKGYYNANRVHVSLEGQTPLDVATATKPDIAELTNFPVDLRLWRARTASGGHISNNSRQTSLPGVTIRNEGFSPLDPSLIRSVVLETRY